VSKKNDEEYDIAFVQNDQVSFLALKTQEIWANKDVNCPGYSKTGKIFVHYEQWMRMSNIPYYQELKVVPQHYLASKFGGGQFDVGGPPSQIISHLSPLQPGKVIVVPRCSVIVTSSEEEITNRFQQRMKMFKDEKPFPHFKAHVILGSEFEKNKEPLKLEESEYDGKLQVGDDISFNIFKKNKNYIGQTSTVLLAKQSLFRILCDTKHDKKEMLLSKLKEFSRVNDELQVLLGKSKVSTLTDYRDHRQIEVLIKDKKKRNEV